MGKCRVETNLRNLAPEPPGHLSPQITINLESLALKWPGLHSTFNGQPLRAVYRFLVSYAREFKESFDVTLTHPLNSIIPCHLCNRITTYQCFSHGEESINPCLVVKYLWKHIIGSVCGGDMQNFLHICQT